MILSSVIFRTQHCTRLYIVLKCNNNTKLVVYLFCTIAAQNEVLLHRNSVLRLKFNYISNERCERLSEMKLFIAF